MTTLSLKPSHDIKADIKLLREQMDAYSKALNFENAIECRDRLKRLEKELQIRDGRN